MLEATSSPKKPLYTVAQCDKEAQKNKWRAAPFLILSAILIIISLSVSQKLHAHPYTAKVYGAVMGPIFAVISLIGIGFSLNVDSWEEEGRKLKAARQDRELHVDVHGDL